MKYLLILLSFNVYAGFSDLGEDAYKYDIKKKTSKKVYRKHKKKLKKSELKLLLSKINENDELISGILEKSEKRIIVRKSQDKLKSLTRIRGTLLNSVVATNRRKTTLVIKLKENEFFDEAEVRCNGMSFGKRVIGNCNLVVSDKEYEVEAELWDMDGAEGIISDQFYDGKEKDFLTSSFASFFTGVMDATKDRVMTPFGESERSNAKNKVLSGLIGASNNIGTKVRESGEKNLQIALINAGKEVYIFFQKGVQL